MQAVRCHEFGEPGALSVEDVESPPPGAGQIRIAIEAASINYFDVLMVQGKYQRRPSLPFTPGTDAAGQVVDVGAGVTRFKPGDRVVAFDWMGGAFAEEMLVPETNAYALPATVRYADGAAMKSVYGTALYTLRDRAKLQPGETLLVLGASGGVGLALVDIGLHVGARVIAVVSSAAKAAAVLQRGAVQIVVGPAEALRQQVAAITAGSGVDVVADPVGGDLFDQAIRVAAWGARVCVLGFASGRIPTLAANYALLKGFDLLGVNYGAWVDKNPDNHRQQTELLLDWCAQGLLTPPVSQVFPLEQAGKAMGLLLDRLAVGKLILSGRTGTRVQERARG